jgi:hypothetical protein
VPGYDPAVPDVDPPPRKYTLSGDRKFDVVNPSAGSPRTSESIDLQALISSANTPRPASPPPPPAAGVPENDVQALLRTNAAHEAAARLPTPPPPPRPPSRRKRDYFFTLIAGNLMLAAAVVITGFNVVVLAFGAAGMIVLTLGLTWIMWFVMDDY